MNTRGERQLATRRDDTYPRRAEPRRCCLAHTGLCCTGYHPIHADLDRRVDEERRTVYHHADSDADQRDHPVGRRILPASVKPAEYQGIPSRRRERSDRVQPIPAGIAPYLLTGRRPGPQAAIEDSNVWCCDDRQNPPGRYPHYRHHRIMPRPSNATAAAPVPVPPRAAARTGGTRPASNPTNASRPAADRTSPECRAHADGSASWWCTSAQPLRSPHPR